VLAVYDPLAELSKERSLVAARNRGLVSWLTSSLDANLARVGGAGYAPFATRARAEHDARVTALSRVLWVGLGGMAGSIVRYLLSALLLKWLGPAFPFGTVAVNLIGSFLLGVLMAVGLHSTSLGPNAQLGLTTGVMGGFTTYSTFNFETIRLLEERAWGLAALNVAVTLFGCLAVGWLGWQGATWLLSGRAAR
jgi:fluoride exporter